MKLVSLVIIGVVLGGIPLGGVSLFVHSHKSTTGVIIPIYSYPNDSWDDLIHEKKHHESVPMITIINPDNGPGIKNPDFATGIEKLQHAKITVLGYVPTNYGSRNFSSVISDIDSYRNWYHVNGIFLDEMAHNPGFEAYYANLTKYSKSIGMNMVVGNPGIDTIPSYIGTVDNIVIYENSGLPPADLFGGWHSNYTKSNFSIIIYNVASINSTNIKFLSDHARYIYATDQSLPNPWNIPSSYLDGILSSLKIEDHHDEDHDEDSERYES